jgi:ABC-type Fe3+ transport system permease subunit
MKKSLQRISSLCLMLYLCFPAIALAGGPPASTLVVVADTRRVSNDIAKYFADLYNTNILLFAVWAVVLTAAWGVTLGLVMDFIMSRTGLDLKSRKIIEH